MIADEGGTMKVSGRTIATPFTDPSPGIAPMKRPAVTPRITIVRLNGDNEVANPSARSARISITGTSEEGCVKRKEQGLCPALRQQDLQRHLEEEEQEQGRRHQKT